jgi:peptide-methionine (R)-S-oxide reductase
MLHKITIFTILLLVFCFASYGQGNLKFSIMKTESEWKKKLTSDQYKVLREKGTEPPYSGKLCTNKSNGTYVCAGCGNELFKSDTKYDSGCGWPSFYDANGNDKIVTQMDYSYDMIRTEIMCAKCGGHLGHVFDDGPAPTGQRYCVNSLSMNFIPESELKSGN